MLFDTAKVIQLRHKPEERRLMIKEMFQSAKQQGAKTRSMAAQRKSAQNPLLRPCFL